MDKNKIQCPKCFNLIPSDSHFCNKCGYKFFEGKQNITFDLINYPYYTNYFHNIDSYIDVALKAYKNSNYFETLENIDNFLIKNPDNAIVWSFKSYVLFKLEYFDDALYCCDVSLNIDDLLEFSWLTRAIILINQNMKKEALLSFDEYLTINANYDSMVELKEFMDSIFKTDIKSIVFNPNYYYNFENEYTNHITTMEELFTQNNLDKIKSNNLTKSDYMGILNKIKETSDFVREKLIHENFINPASLDLFSKILLYSKSFAEIEIKASFGSLGSYRLNKIEIEDRLFASDMITTLIHELAHHILAEIFEQSIMKILNSSKSEVIEEFVSEILSSDEELKLMDEYCAHTVQGRFSPYSFQDYGSWEKIIEEEFYEGDPRIQKAKIVGKTFSDDICNLMEFYIDEQLRDEIKKQFIFDNKDSFDVNGVFQESTTVMNDEGKIEIINNIIKFNFEKNIF